MTETSTRLTAAAAGTLTIGGDLTVHRLGFGAMRITGPGVWGEPRDLQSARAVLKRAIELEVNFIDTADSYGPEVSERLIGETLYPYPPGLVIATKGGLERPGPDQWVANGRPEHLRAALEGSLRRLRLETIDLYQLHRPDPRVPLAESLGALSQMQREGKIRHIGVSNFNKRQLAEAQSIVTVVSVQNRFNLFDRSSEDELDECTRQNLAFLPWAPVAPWELSQAQVIDRVAAHYQATPTQVVLAWLLQRSPVMLPIPGTSSPAHLEENVAAAQIRLDPDDVSALDSLGG